jgi:hypothetical protein
MASPQPPAPAAAVIAQWAASGTQSKETAARLAAELAAASPATPLEPCAATAARLGITVSMAVQARRHLTAQRLIAKHGNRYYPAPGNDAFRQWETSGYLVLRAAAAIARHLHHQQPGTPATTRTLNAALGLPYGTIDRAKRILAAHGILSKDPDGRYRIP